MKPVNRCRIRNGYQYIRKRNFCKVFMFSSVLSLLCCIPTAASSQELDEGWNPAGIGEEQSLPAMPDGQYPSEPGNGQDVSENEGMPEPEDQQEPPEDQDVQKPEKETNPEVKISVTLQGEKNAAVSWPDVKAVSYKVQRSTQKDGSYKTIVTLGKGKHGYIDKTGKSGQKYYYRVKASFDKNGSVYSKPVAFSCPLSKVTDVKLTRYSSSSIKVSWKSSGGAKYYKVYCSKTKGKYEYAGITKNDCFRVKKLETGKKYYFYVQACVGKKESKLDSVMSKAAAMQTKAYDRLTIFAGDSITVGLNSYRALDAMNIGGIKNVVADIGLNTTTFRTRRVFNGKSGLEQVISSKPYRVYLMLGMNEIHYRSSKDVAEGYEDIVKAIRAGTPDTDIVLLSVSPVTKSEQQRRKGFAQIPDLNKRIMTIASNLGVKYYDYTSFLKGADGCLKPGLSSSDGVHWTSSAYHTFAEVMQKYDLSQD